MIEIDSEARTPMLRRYSIWIGETERSVDRLRSIGSPPNCLPGSTGTGVSLTLAMIRRRLRRYRARACWGMSLLG